MKRYFVDTAGRIAGECIVENPANPENLAIVELGEIVGAHLDYLYQDGTAVYSPIPKTPEQLRAEARQQRAAAVAAIEVTTQAGNTFDGDEVSQGRMARAIIALQATGTPSVTWVLADNSVIQATVAELTEALTLAGAAQAAIWVLA